MVELKKFFRDTKFLSINTFVFPLRRVAAEGLEENTVYAARRRVFNKPIHLKRKKNE